jgi:predicted nucleic acid-binding protein
MNSFVFDASVVLGFLLQGKKEAEREIALLLEQAAANKLQIFSTPLLVFEVGNGLKYSSKDGFTAEGLMEAFADCSIEYIAFSKTQTVEILRLSQELNTTFYDTSYHYLALFQKTTLLTADEKYFNKGKELGNIKLLKFS